MNETGSVKFRYDHLKAELTEFAGFDELKEYRARLIDLGFIGIDENGIGFGNVSVRDGQTTRFHITGSATGGLTNFAPADCATVLKYDFTSNWLQCTGETVASSESLTHAAVYESDPAAGAVIHCHNMKLWSALLDKAPTTPKGIEYGTPEMAGAVRQLFTSTDVKKGKLFVMGAHDGGLVAFGRDLAEAFAALRAKV